MVSQLKLYIFVKTRDEKRMIKSCNILITNNIRIGGGNFSHLTFLRYFLKNDAVLQASKFAKWLFLFLFFALLGACNEADEPHFSALDTQNLLLGTHVLKSRTTASGIKEMEWEGHYVAFTPDSVRFYSLVPEVFFPLFLGGKDSLIGCKTDIYAHYGVEYLPQNVLFNDIKYKVLPISQDKILLGDGKEWMELEREKGNN